MESSLEHPEYFDCDGSYARIDRIEEKVCELKADPEYMDTNERMLEAIAERMVDEQDEKDRYDWETRNC